MKTIISTIIIALLSCTSFVFAQQNLPSDFPEYQDTGDKKADNTTYDQAKKAWVEANPEAYQKMGGQIEAKPETNEHSIETQAENCEKTEDATVIIPDNCMIWKITDAIIIDRNNQLKTSELDEAQVDYKKEILTREVLWKISTDGMLYILNDGQYTNHFKFEKTDNELKLFPHNDASCNNQVKNFQIEKWTDTQIIINMPDEDEGSTLIYQLVLTSEF